MQCTYKNSLLHRFLLKISWMLNENKLFWLRFISFSYSLFWKEYFVQCTYNLFYYIYCCISLAYCFPEKEDFAQYTYIIFSRRNIFVEGTYEFGLFSDDYVCWWCSRVYPYFFFPVIENIAKKICIIVGQKYEFPLPYVPISGLTKILVSPRCIFLV